MKSLKLTIASTTILLLLSACGGGSGGSGTNDAISDVPKGFIQNNNNLAPVIEGNPLTNITEGNLYQFTPVSSDAENDRLIFNISNKPSWLNLDASTGELSGIPSTGDIGVFDNIKISVTDGTSIAFLTTFSITVAPGLPLQISGVPSLIAGENRPYSFTPVVTNKNNNPLLFSIVNKPAWLIFDQSSGTLSGTPTETEIGVYNNIQISVNDGANEATLASFNLTVESTSALLSWVAPTTLTDNTPLLLSDLSGYRVYSGTDLNNLRLLVDIGDPTVNEYKINNLPPATHYYAVTVYGQALAESSFSAIVSKTIN